MLPCPFHFGASLSPYNATIIMDRALVHLAMCIHITRVTITPAGEDQLVGY
jgi:hypothetical protein